MARFEVTLPPDMIRQLDKLGSKGDEISQKMLKAGAAILKDEIDKNLKKNLYSGRKYDKNYPTGALERSLTADKPKKDKNGNHYIRIYFKGKDSKGVPNALKAAVMEYGSSKQPKKPFIRPAEKAVEKEVNAEMQRVFDNEINRLEG